MKFNLDLKEFASVLSCSFVLRDATEKEKEEIRRMQNHDTYIKLNIAACIFCLIQIFFIVSDLLSGFYEKIDVSNLNIAAELLISLSSIMTLVTLNMLKDKAGDAVPVIHVTYYFFLETGSALYLCSDMLRGLDNVYNSFYNLFILSVFPIYSWEALRAFAVYTCTLTVALTYAIPNMLNWERIQMIPLFLVLMFFCANYFRARNTGQFYTRAKLAELAEQFKDLSNRDFLTQLPNRTALNRYLETKVAATVDSRQTVGLIMVDVDDFKRFNDFHSHMEGDNCLRRVGEAFLSLSDEKFRFFRYGGEEFLAVGIGISEPELLDFAANLNGTVNDLDILREDHVNDLGHVTASIGCSMAVLNAWEEYHQLLRIADQALYHAKHQGKNCFVYEKAKYPFSVDV